MFDNNDLDYEKSLEYWAEIPATIDGVLGGFGHISSIDIDGSKLFLKSLSSLAKPPRTKLALDCGAGIGRISKQLLLPQFSTVDIIEPDEKFISSIMEYVGEDCTKIGSMYRISLQEFKPERKYDVIWNQWVLGYLTDDDLVLYLKQCSDALAENGVIIVKENVTSTGKPEKDEIDSSITRSLGQFTKIFKRANLKRIKQSKQVNFPNGIFPVYMFALRPKSNYNSDIVTS